MKYSYGTFKQLDVSAAEALLAFCRLVNPLGNAFHPNALQTVIESWMQKKGPNCRKFFRQFFNIHGMLEKSWNISLNPNGPLPKQIHCETNSTLRCALKWKNWRGGGTTITLTFLGGGTDQKIFLAVTSHDLSTAEHYAELAGLPEPKLEQDMRPRFVFTLTPQPHVPIQKSIWDVQIPLGDLLDFIQKYR